MLILGGQHDKLIVIKMKLELVPSFIVVKVCVSSLTGNFDIFYRNLTFVPFSIGKSKLTISDFTHFENALGVTIAIAIDNLEQILCFFAG